MSLRNQMIRLAYANPELRKDLLPLLKEARFEADEAYTKDIAKAVGRAKRSLGLQVVRQNYKGTGAQAAARQIFLRPGGEWSGAQPADLWLEKYGFRLGTPPTIWGKGLYTGNPARDTKAILKVIEEWMGGLGAFYETGA